MMAAAVLSVSGCLSAPQDDGQQLPVVHQPLSHLEHHQHGAAEHLEHVDEGLRELAQAQADQRAILNHPLEEQVDDGLQLLDELGTDLPAERLQHGLHRVDRVAEVFRLRRGLGAHAGAEIVEEVDHPLEALLPLGKERQKSRELAAEDGEGLVVPLGRRLDLPEA